MNFDLPIPVIGKIVLFDTPGIFKPGNKEAPQSASIPGFKESSLGTEMGESEFFNKQMEVQCSLEYPGEKISFLSDDLQNLKFVKLVLEENTTKTVISDQGAVAADLSATHNIALYSLKEIYNGAIKTAIVRRPIPNPNTVTSFGVSVFLKLDYDLLKEALNLSSSDTLEKQQETKVTRNIISGGIIETSLALVDDTAVESLGEEGNFSTSDVVALKAARVRQNNPIVSADYTSEAQVIKTNISQFSIASFLDRRKLAVQQTQFKALSSNLTVTEVGDVVNLSPIKNISLEMSNGEDTIKLSYPKSTTLSGDVYHYSCEVLNIKNKDLIVFNIGGKKLQNEYELKYYYEVRDGFRQFLLNKGAVIKKDIGKLTKLLGEYAVMPSTNTSAVKHEDIFPYGKDWAESHAAHASIASLADIRTVNSLELGAQNLISIIRICIASNVFQSNAAKDFIETVVNAPTPSSEQEVRTLLGIYQKAEHFYVLNGLPLEPEYSTASATQGAIQASSMSHSNFNDTLSLSRSSKKPVAFEKKLGGYSFLTQSSIFLKYPKSALMFRATAESRKYLAAGVMEAGGNVNILSPLALNGMATMHLNFNFFSYFTPSSYINEKGTQENNSFTSDDDFFDKEKNLLRVLRVLLESGEPEEFLQAWEGAKVTPQSITIPNQTSNIDKQMTESLNDVSLVGTILGNTLTEQNDFMRFIVFTLLSKYLPDPEHIRKDINYLFSIFTGDSGLSLPQGEQPVLLREQAPNQFLLFADNNKGVNKNILKFSPSNDPLLKSDDIDANGMEDYRNYPFFFNHLLNLCRLEKIESFKGGFVSSPVWTSVTPADVTGDETLLCRFVRPLGVPKSLELPIYNEMFLLVNSSAPTVQLSSAPTVQLGGG